VIERQTTRMQDLIDSLLDLTRLETDRMSLALAEVNLGRLVTRVGEMMEMAQEDRQILFDLSSEPVIIVADEHRIEQVVMNLLSNALRFSPEGGW
jgi:signal transduction histidine kinase